MGAHFPGSFPRWTPQGVADDEVSMGIEADGVSIGIGDGGVVSMGMGAGDVSIDIEADGASEYAGTAESDFVASSVTGLTGTAQESPGADWDVLLFAVFSICGECLL